ncbi:long-chain fatty acid--CoA ligase [Leptospira wolffii]|uniref:AMP-dependent synthetase/ligase n=1 Tax=Leptospira wolffii TaxID=409998 RepID=UPI0010832EC8|nr:AMP-binding protein [Leptospira wolffii]TGK59448.1 long-chain fatty acid--CoA ligase [Leptospira wolffii]TGK71169.1 long-chain fatty acid--CoA ligase [Leptospira wolffii]TGK77737.1 long-chain fatty acid--CoA ligase [Leptospira wolffii]TGL29553.1 long-chain fatty acid--CoA ligase [Leptospira wolffii]
MEPLRLPFLHSQTLYWMMKSSSEAFSNSPAQFFKPDGKTYKSIAFRELNDLVVRIGLGLVSIGAQKGQNIGLIADSGHRWIWVSLGITNIGSVDVPRGTDSTIEDLVYILNHAKTEVCFAGNSEVVRKISANADAFPHLKTVILFEPPSHPFSKTPFRILHLDDLISLGDRWIQEKGELEFHKRGESVRETDLATIVYTSGTTGRPKGVMLSHRNIIFNVNMSLSLDDIRITPADRTMAYLPPWHIAERLIETACIRAGASEAFTSISSLGQDLQDIKPTFLLSVPRVWESFYNKVQDKLKDASPVGKFLFKTFQSVAASYYTYKSRFVGLEFTLHKRNLLLEIVYRSVAFFGALLYFVPNILAQALFSKIRNSLGGNLKFAISGAGALPEYIDRFFNSIGIPILEGYGMTETSGASTRRRLDRISVGTLGKCIPGVEIKILDEKGEEIHEPGIKGIAWHRGDHIMQGYYLDPEKTAETIKDGWLNSGDLLLWTAQGELKYAGRAKDTIVLLGGENLEPEPIEFALTQSELVLQAMVVGHDQKVLGALLVPDWDVLDKQLREWKSRLLQEIEDPNSDPDVRELFKKEIKERVSAKNGFKNFEKVSNFYLLPKKFEPGDELTMTMKIRRNVVSDKYKDQIEELYR